MKEFENTYLKSDRIKTNEEYFKEAYDKFTAELDKCTQELKEERKEEEQTLPYNN